MVPDILASVSAPSVSVNQPGPRVRSDSPRVTVSSTVPELVEVH